MAAHLGDDRDVGQCLLELVPQPRPALAYALDQSLALDHVDDGEADSARERRAVPRVPEGELPRTVRDRVVHVLLAEHRADRRIAGAEPLCRGDQVRHERRLVRREPLARPADARDDLVEADEETVPASPLFEALPEAQRRRVRRERRGADPLHEER